MKQSKHKINYKNNNYSNYHLRTNVDTIDNRIKTIGFITLDVNEEFVYGADVIQFTEESDRDYLTISVVTCERRICPIFKI